MNADAIIAAVRGVLLGDLGSVRVIAPGRFVDGVPADLDNDVARHNRAIERPSFDVEMDPSVNTGALGPSNASRVILSSPVTVTLTYALSEVADVEASAHRRSVRATAAADSLAVTQALTWNRNLHIDPDGTATHLINGSLRPTVGRPVTREDWDAGVYELELTFTALVVEAQAVA